MRTFIRQAREKEDLNAFSLFPTGFCSTTSFARRCSAGRGRRAGESGSRVKSKDAQIREEEEEEEV